MSLHQFVLAFIVGLVLAAKALAQISELTSPHLIPDSEESVFRTGSRFELLCEATKPIVWTLPEFSRHLTITHDLNDRKEITELRPTAKYQYRSMLTVSDASFLDTGYYTCSHQGEDGHSQSSRATYIYVEDDQNLIVTKEDFVTVVVHQLSTEVIPCKPTSPRVELTLIDPEGNEIYPFASMRSGWSYNPHTGFTVNEVHVEMEGFYECRASIPDSETVTVTFNVLVQSVANGAPKPLINSTAAEQISVGQKFQLNCSAAFELGVTGQLIWTVPHPEGIDGSRIRTSKLQSFRRMDSSGMEQTIFHQVLIVKNATAEDQGDYECKSLDHSNNWEVDRVFVTIHDFNAKYVNISDEGLDPYLEEDANKTIQWVVRFTAFPTPEIVWSKGNDANIIKKNILKYEVKNDQKSTVLMIKHATIADSDVYRLTITAAKEQGVREFTLRIRDRPSIVATSSPSNVIRLGEQFIIRCRVTAYPLPEKVLNVFFQECSPGTNMESNCQPNQPLWNQLVGSMNKTENSEIITSHKEDLQTLKVEVSGTARVPGKYVCKACNEVGCSSHDSSSVNFYVTELSAHASDGAELTRSLTHDPVRGQYFSLLCAASLYNFTNQMSWWWTPANGTTLPVSSTRLPPGAKLLQPLRKFVHAEMLEWKTVAMNTNGIFTCQVTGGVRTVNMTSSLRVVEPRQPRVVKASESQTSIEQYAELSLYCEVDGLPTPTVDWFKNGEFVSNGVMEKGVSWFIIRHAKIDDAGQYDCKLSNLAGNSQQSFYVSVLNPPVHKGIIAGIVIAVLIVVVVLAILVKKIYQDEKRKKFFRANQLDIFDKGNPESINPDLPIDEQTELLPYDKRWEFPRDQLKLGKQLGAGAFGRVLKGDATGIDSAEPVTTVAVKMVRSQGNMIGLKALMSELKIMIHMGSHLNVVNLLGACTKNVTKGELLVIVEYCRYGNIQNYLIRHRAHFINQVNRRGLIDAEIGAEQLAEAQARRSYDTPRSPSKVADLNYSGGPTGATEISFLSMAPTGAEAPDLMDVTDSSGGHPTLTSAPSNSSGGPQSPSAYPPWRSNYRGDYRDEPEKPICTRDLLCWAFQIARGMDYLARRKILHGDLATRNVLLAENNIVKIADFGLAREVYRSGNYKKKGEGPLPVKWMAIESITDRVFSTQSDVWSFGIVLWELFSLGKTPYPGMEADEQFFLRLQQGYRMDKPKYATNQIYDVMHNCWAHDPFLRPSFDSLSETLGSQLDASVRRHYIDLNDAYVKSNAQWSTESTDYLSMMSPVDYVNVGGRPSPMPDRRTYVNMPNNTLDTTDERQSEYLHMTGASNKSTSSPRDLGARGSDEGEANSYLFMTNPQPTSSKPKTHSPTNTNNQFNHFDFSFAPKLRKGKDEELLDSVEMRPMLSPSPASSPVKIEGETPNGFSNPNYQNPPPLISLTSVVCSDLDDPPATCVSAIARPNDKVGDQHYINIPQKPVDLQQESRMADVHYVNPKNNGPVV